MSDPAFQQMSEEEYLRSEPLSAVKREYVAGFVYPLRGTSRAQTGATSKHGELCISLVLALAPTTRQQGCATYQSDMRVSVRSPTGKAAYYYPDIVVTCEPPGRRRDHRHLALPHRGGAQPRHPAQRPDRQTVGLHQPEQPPDLPDYRTPPSAWYG
nr:Uma2 family endonuclease [Deinococcus sp.]